MVNKKPPAINLEGGLYLFKTIKSNFILKSPDWNKNFMYPKCTPK
jgi:hypothetical protein